MGKMNKNLKLAILFTILGFASNALFLVETYATAAVIVVLFTIAFSEWFIFILDKIRASKVKGPVSRTLVYGLTILGVAMVVSGYGVVNVNSDDWISQLFGAILLIVALPSLGGMLIIDVLVAVFLNFQRKKENRENKLN